MLGSAVVVFRETLEAALIVAIVRGATRGVAHRGRWVAGGVALGIIGALLVALFAGAISQAVEGRGQELFNATVLLTGIPVAADAMWRAVQRHAGGRALGKVRFAPDPAVQAIIDTVPRATRSERAARLGFGHNATFDEVVIEYVETLPS